MAEFNLATPDVERLAKELIEEYHSFLAGARIAYMTRSGGWSSKSRDTWGKTFKVDDKSKVLMVEPYDFEIVVNEVVWQALKLYQKKALMDHLLSFCTLNEDTGQWGLATEDLKDFALVVRRHGVWNEDVAKYLRAAEEGPGVRMEQLGLPVDEDAPLEELAAELVGKVGLEGARAVVKVVQMGKAREAAVGE